MNQHLVQTYLNELDRLHKITGVKTEQVIRPAFRRMLDDWARSQNLIFVEELEYTTTQKTRVYPDGTVLHDIRVPLGHWEAKDTNDDLDTEIGKKLKRGYPQDNIIFENSEAAVLIQNRQEVMRCSMQDVEALERLVYLFFGWERPEIAQFRKAVEQFKADLPAVLGALRERIDSAYAENAEFRAAGDAFLDQAKQTINPSVTEADVREMLIQHILTEEIFTHVFNEGDFHRENNIAKELYDLEAKFFTGAVKRETLKALEPYYAAIRSNAAQISGHHEKQTFLKVIYENFYKVYNPKAADRLGVVYTPNEIVRFMIEGADWLCQKHFGKALIDPDVEILDPATGTGTFVCEILEHFRGQPQKLAHKYKEELHANEVAILPYYVANLNIEATYYGLTKEYAEFPNLCFVDTLDNTAGLGVRIGQHVGDLFGAISEENVERIKRQNRRKISVIIGNPPYNAGQLNELNANKNRDYRHVDEQIRQTYVELSKAQKTLVYDMYTRFFRWASDRLNDDGVLALVTNRSFIDSRTFDGFRRAVTNEFNGIYVVDLGGDVRANPKLSGTKHNVFGIQTGIAISFMIKRHKQKGCKIFYGRRPEFDTAQDKLAFLASNKAQNIAWQRIEPDRNENWINLTDNDWDSLIPVADKKTKAAKVKIQERAIFRVFSTGIMSGRDEWVYDLSEPELSAKMSFLIAEYSRLPAEDDNFPTMIKLSRNLRRRLGRTDLQRRTEFETVQFRPFVTKRIFLSPVFVDELGASLSAFASGNRVIGFLSVASANPLTALASDKAIDYGLLKNGNGGTQQLPRYRYTAAGERVDNITDWGLKQFHAHYGKDQARPITKDDIFHYVYGVLHDPVYRETYAINLKRDFPRVPFYPDFRQWAEWGETLMALHIGYEAVEPWPLERIDTPDEKAREAGVAPKTILKADRDNGIIVLDSETQLSGVPAEAWTYRLGNRSAIDWILDQYKEKTPRDPTIRERFNTYRFADYKEQVVDLIKRVTRVSVETMEIVNRMQAAKR